MANKFKNAVMERLEQENQQQRSPKPVPEQAAPEAVAAPKQPEPKAKNAGGKRKTAKAGNTTTKPIGKEPAEVTLTQPVKLVTDGIAYVPEEPATPVLDSEAPIPAVQSKLPDLSAFLRPDPARQAKNKTFYLDVAVIDAVKAAAAAGHVTDSKLVNDILRAVLGLEG